MYAGELSEPMQPFAAMTIKGLYEDAACIVPGNNERYCPVGAHDEHGSKTQRCWGGHCVSHTDFCAETQVATFERQEKRDPKTGHLEVKQVPRWEHKHVPHLCCHYPETEAVWDSRWARINLYDEDTFGGNDYLGGVDLDLQNKTGGEFEFTVAEHADDFSLKGNNFTMKVATFWHRPMEFEVQYWIVDLLKKKKRCDDFDAFYQVNPGLTRVRLRPDARCQELDRSIDICRGHSREPPVPCPRVAHLGVARVRLRPDALVFARTHGDVVRPSLGGAQGVHAGQLMYMYLCR